MGEKDLWDLVVLTMEVIEIDHVFLRKAIVDLVETREHNPQPGAAAFAEGHDDAVGIAEFAELIATAQPTSDDNFFFRREEKRAVLVPRTAVLSE